MMKTSGVINVPRSYDNLIYSLRKCHILMAARHVVDSITFWCFRCRSLFRGTNRKSVTAMERNHGNTTINNGNFLRFWCIGETLLPRHLMDLHWGLIELHPVFQEKECWWMHALILVSLPCVSAVGIANTYFFRMHSLSIEISVDLCASVWLLLPTAMF